MTNKCVSSGVTKSDPSHPIPTSPPSCIVRCLSRWPTSTIPLSPVPMNVRNFLCLCPLKDEGSLIISRLTGGMVTLWHAFYGLFLWVFTRFAHITQLDRLWVGGSFSPRLITNGAYSLAIYLTDGHYGSVTYQRFTLVSSPTWIDFSNSTDLFPHTHSQSHVCDTWHHWDGHYDFG